MKLWFRLRPFLLPDAQADRVVPPTGFTARLTVFVAGAMTFLAVFVLALSLSAGRLAQDWSRDLAQAATIRVQAPLGETQAQTEAVLRVLETTPGVTEARTMTDAEQAALLAPWFGDAFNVEDLPVPRIIALQIAPRRFDPDSLRLRLQAEAPAAHLDDHGRWRAPLIRAAGRLRLLGWGSAILILAALGAMVTLAANASLAANRPVISVLRLVGATDTYIATAFVRRFTYRAALGAAGGAFLGVLSLWILPTNAQTDVAGLLTGLGYRGAGWLVPLCLPLLAALVALAATATAARKALKDLA